jgi:hypothetical protein
MTEFVNIRIQNEKALVDPDLKELVNKLILINPKLVFVESKHASLYDYSVRYSWGGNKEKYTAPEGFQYLYKLAVYEENEQVGMVSVDRGGKGDLGFTYNVTNWRIEKSRGARNTTSTSKMEVALRECKKQFKRRNISELYDKAYEDSRQAFNSACRELRDPISGGRIIPHRDGFQVLAYCLVNGIVVDNPELVLMQEKLKTEEYSKAIQEYLLVSDMSSRPLELYVDIGGRFAFKGMVEGQADVQLISKPYEELSEKVQSQIAVLQLMQNNELVRDVGFRYRAGIYLLTV